MKIPVLLVILAVIQPLDIFGIGTEAESLADIGDRTGKIRQQVFSALHVRRIDAGEIRRFDVLDRYSAGETVIFALHV